MSDNKNIWVWVLALLVGLAMLSAALWLPAAIDGILSGPLISLSLFWLVFAFGVLVTGFLVLKRG